MSVIKYSRQREAIKEYLYDTKEHPTADTVYMKIRTVYPNVSLGTVYRNLNLLVELGEVNKINCQDGSVRFDGNRDPHYHVVCKECGNVFDIEIDAMDQMDQLAKTSFDGTIEGHVAYFYGTCSQCLNKKK